MPSPSRCRRSRASRRARADRRCSPPGRRARRPGPTRARAAASCVRARQRAASARPRPEHHERTDRRVERAASEIGVAERERRQLGERQSRHGTGPQPAARFSFERSLFTSKRESMRSSARDLREQLAQQRLARRAIGHAQADLEHGAHQVAAVRDRDRTDAARDPRAAAPRAQREPEPRARAPRAARASTPRRSGSSRSCRGTPTRARARPASRGSSAARGSPRSSARRSAARRSARASPSPRRAAPTGTAARSARPSCGSRAA